MVLASKMGTFNDEELVRVLNDGTSDANFADKFVGDEAARRISEALSNNNCSKTRVLLDRNCVGADGATAVGDMLKVCWSSKRDARVRAAASIGHLVVFHRVSVVSSREIVLESSYAVVQQRNIRRSVYRYVLCATNPDTIQIFQSLSRTRQLYLINTDGSTTLYVPTFFKCCVSCPFVASA